MTKTARIDWLVLGIAALGMALSGACAKSDSRASRAQCEALRRHAVRLELESTRKYAGEAATREVLAQHENALIASLGEPYLAACQEQRWSSDVECALAAPSNDGLQACERKQ